MTRAADADATGEFAQHKQVFVTGGNVRAGQTFEQTTAGAITVNTTAIAFAAVPGITGLKIRNNTNGAELDMPGVQVLSGDTLVIDFLNRHVTFNGVDSPALVSDQSTWWDAGVAGLAPGNNTIQASTFTGVAGSAVALTFAVGWHEGFV
jgi:hypothetical protein